VNCTELTRGATYQIALNSSSDSGPLLFHLFKQGNCKMKRITKLLIAAVAIMAGLLAVGPNPAQAEQYLIVAKGNGFSDAFDAAVKDAGGTMQQKLSVIGVAVARSDDVDFPAKAAAIPEVQSVVPDPALPIERDTYADGESSGGGSPWGNSPPDLTGFQWDRKATHADAARQLGITGKGVRVVVMDGSIMTKHPGLAKSLNVSLSKSFVDGEDVEFSPSTALTRFSHATHVAGIIAANLVNGGGTIGVAPDAELVLAKVGRDADETVRPSAAIAALVYAADIQADVARPKRVPCVAWGERLHPPTAPPVSGSAPR
jgi:hypothetical protein